MNSLIDENFPQCMTWNICRYTRWINNDNNSNDDTGKQESKEWHETADCKIELRITGFGHFLITSGFHVLESYFLVDAKHWFKATNKGIRDSQIVLSIFVTV